MPEKIDAVRSLTDERLAEEEFNTRMDLLNLRFRAATRQLANTNELRAARRRLAHILTVKRERELLGSGA